jgi:secondary thiamine-phosphate synthase enzyme
MSRTAQFEVDTRGKGLYEITARVREAVREADVDAGLCTVFVRHTSASLTIQENADPSAKADLEAFIERLVPENDPHYTHTAEGPDDMPAHIKAALTSPSLGIPVIGGEPALGTWQGVYLWEHRSSPHTRRVVVHVG